jgi:hypothetical protein
VFLSLFRFADADMVLGSDLSPPHSRGSRRAPLTGPTIHLIERNFAMPLRASTLPETGGGTHIAPIVYIAVPNAAGGSAGASVSVPIVLPGRRYSMADIA